MPRPIFPAPLVALPLAATALFTAAAAPLPAGPLQVASRILVEQRVAAADGTTRIVARPGARARPGDRLIVEIFYRNTGQQPIADLIIANPVPADLAYRGVAPGTPPPELSTDGRRFVVAGTLAAPAGGAAAPADVVAVRWRLSRPLAPGGSGTFAFRAVLK